MPCRRGGTILKSARSQKFMTKEGRQQAFDQLVNNGIEGLVAIGGNGTFTGATIFEEEFGIPTVGPRAPSTTTCSAPITLSATTRQ
jgi:6-phosphofructokinase 1